MTKLIGKGQAMRQLSPDEYNSEFEGNYEYYRQRMERRLVKQVYDRERFDDICQDAFVRALTYFARQNAKLPQTDYHLGNLLCDIAVQVAIDDYRKNKSKDYMYLSESEACKQLPEPMVEGHEGRICDRDGLQRVLDQMPLRHRQIVQLIDQGLNQKEIAEQLGKSASTVSGMLRDVKTQLRKYYPVTINLHHAEALYTEQEIERILESLVEGTLWERSDEVRKLERIFCRRYTREQVSFVNNFDSKEFKELVDVTDIDMKQVHTFNGNGTRNALFVRPSKLIVLRGVKVSNAR